MTDEEKFDALVADAMERFKVDAEEIKKRVFRKKVSQAIVTGTTRRLNSRWRKLIVEMEDLFLDCFAKNQQERDWYSGCASGLGFDHNNAVHAGIATYYHTMLKYISGKGKK